VELRTGDGVAAAVATQKSGDAAAPRVRFLDKWKEEGEGVLRLHGFETARGEWGAHRWRFLSGARGAGEARYG
jgi:hypothetical protein